MNQPSALSSVVPVLPAAGRSPSEAARPVPSFMTLVSSCVVPLATSGSMTCLQPVLPILTGFLSLVVIDRIGLGGQYLPLAARVAYDAARVSGVASSEPSVTGDG